MTFLYSSASACTHGMWTWNVVFHHVYTVDRESIKRIKGSFEDVMKVRQAGWQRRFCVWNGMRAVNGSADMAEQSSVSVKSSL